MFPCLCVCDVSDKSCLYGASPGRGVFTDTVSSAFLPTALRVALAGVVCSQLSVNQGLIISVFPSPWSGFLPFDLGVEAGSRLGSNNAVKSDKSCPFKLAIWEKDCGGRG